MNYPRPTKPSNDEYSLLKSPKVTCRSLREALLDYIEATRTGVTIDGQPVLSTEKDRRRAVARRLAAYVLARG